MAIKTYRPTTPSRRHMTSLDYKKDITKTRPEKSLVVNLQKTGGRNHRGIITSQHIGGGAKKLYRIIDFKRNKDSVSAKVAAIEYDPNRSSFIALLHYEDGEKRYILAPNGLKVGTHVVSGQKVEPEVGNCMPLESIPQGLSIHNVELRPGCGGSFARSAGMSVVLMAKDDTHAVLALPSGETRRVSKLCRATIGVVGNSDHSMVSIGKAGRSRHMGKRPKTRGSCRNPVDHPMGGGEGKRSGGRHVKGPTGIYAKGGKTRNPRKSSNSMIITRRKKR